MAGTILPPAGYRCIPSVSCISSRGGGCPGEHWYTSGCFGSADSFGLWCNGDSLCAQFASLPCPAGPLNSSTDTVLRKVPVCSPTIPILSKPIRLWHLFWTQNNFHCRGDIIKSPFSSCFFCLYWDELLSALTATPHHLEAEYWAAKRGIRGIKPSLD